MFDTVTTVLLRAVLDEVYESVSPRETGARTHVASEILDAASGGEVSVEVSSTSGARLCRKRRPCGVAKARRG